MGLREEIRNKLDKYTEIVPYHDFSNIVFWVADQFELVKEDAENLVHMELNALNKYIGSQEFQPSTMWPSQEKAIPFGKGNPGMLYNPLSSLDIKKAAELQTGDIVDVQNDTWRAKFRGVIVQVNKDGSVDVEDPNAKQLHENIPFRMLSKPQAQGRDVAPPQYRRVGDNWGLLDGPADIGNPKFIREYPGMYHLPRGQEGQAITNPPDLFYSSLMENVEKKHGKDIALTVKAYLEGEPANPTRELASVLKEYGVGRLV